MGSSGSALTALGSSWSHPACTQGCSSAQRSWHWSSGIWKCQRVTSRELTTSPFCTRARHNRADTDSHCNEVGSNRAAPACELCQQSRVEPRLCTCRCRTCLRSALDFRATRTVCIRVRANAGRSDAHEPERGPPCGVTRWHDAVGLCRQCRSPPSGGGRSQGGTPTAARCSRNWVGSRLVRKCQWTASGQLRQSRDRAERNIRRDMCNFATGRITTCFNTGVERC